MEGKPVTLQVRGTFAITKKSRFGTQQVATIPYDTQQVAGQERFQGLGTSFYRGADGVVFVFDVTRKATTAASASSITLVEYLRGAGRLEEGVPYSNRTRGQR